jgi:hypothetical protein
MRSRFVRVGLPVVLGLLGAWPGFAAAQPVSGPHETIDQRLTTTQPNTPSGFHFTGTYHAAGDPKAYPPYMRKMTAYNQSGARFDTSVPPRCTASDMELMTQGVAACPEGSRLGGGTAESAFLGTFSSKLDLDFINNANEQIILARSPGLATIARGKVFPDGSVEFASPTCYPTLRPPACPDTTLQLSTSVTVPPYTRKVGGRVRSYFTTPATCPAVRYWRTPIRFWWADGSVDTVVTRQPCRRR